MSPKMVKVEMLKDAFGCDLVNGKPGPRKLFKKGTKPELCESVARTFLANGACKKIEIVKERTDENKANNGSSDRTSRRRRSKDFSES